MTATPPPRGWTLRQAAEALCEKAVLRYAEDPERLASALREAVALRADLQLTGHHVTRGTRAKREPVPAILLHDAAITRGTGQISLTLDVADDAARITHSFEAERPDIPVQIEIEDVRVELVAAHAEPPRSFTRAPPPPRTVRGSGGGLGRRFEVVPVVPATLPIGTPSPLEALPPPGGWTLGEAAAALLPALYIAASQPTPKDWWMMGGAEPHKEERTVLRLAFARLMETGDFVADGIALRQSEPSIVPPYVWRAAIVPLGLPGEGPLDTIMAGAGWWGGVRVKRVNAAASVEMAKASPPHAGTRGAKIGKAARRAGGRDVTREVAAAIRDLGAKIGEEGPPRPGSGGQAILEKWFIERVEAQGGTTSESRARVHVRNAIKADKAAHDPKRIAKGSP